MKRISTILFSIYPMYEFIRYFTLYRPHSLKSIIKYTMSYLANTYCRSHNPSTSILAMSYQLSIWTLHFTRYTFNRHYIALSHLMAQYMFYYRYYNNTYTSILIDDYARRKWLSKNPCIVKEWIRWIAIQCSSSFNFFLIPKREPRDLVALYGHVKVLTFFIFHSWRFFSYSLSVLCIQWYININDYYHGKKPHM